MRLVRYRGRWYVAFEEGGKRKRKALGTSDRGTAERRLAELKIAPKRGGTIRHYAESYLSDKAHAGARSIQGLRSAWNTARHTFADLHPEHINRVLCRGYITKRRRAGVSDGTIIKEIGFVRSALSWHKIKGLPFEFPPTPPPKERFLRKPEIDRMIDAARYPHLKLFILLAWATGARAGALFDLTWDQIDFEAQKGIGQIRLAKPGGGRKGRATVPMTREARAALLAAYEARTSDYVVEWAGKPVKSVKKGFAEAARAAGLERVTPHTIRHSSAVAMAEAGKSMAEIAQVLGHTDPRVTFSTYAKYSPGHLVSVIEALE